MDHLQHIDMSMSVGMSFAGVWTITRVLKIRKRARERVARLSIIAVLLIPSIIGGFLTGSGQEVLFHTIGSENPTRAQTHVGTRRAARVAVYLPAGAFPKPGFHPGAQLAQRFACRMPVEGDDSVVILVAVDGAERCQHVKVLKPVGQPMTSLRQHRH